MNNLQSPREKLISNFICECGPDYKKMYLSNISADILHLKLSYYVNVLFLQVRNSNNFHSNLKLFHKNNSISILNDNTLLNTYNIVYVSSIKNENQLGMSLFIDWGYLLHCIGKPENEQLMIAL